MMGSLLWHPRTAQGPPGRLAPNWPSQENKGVPGVGDKSAVDHYELMTVLILHHGREVLVCAQWAASQAWMTQVQRGPSTMCSKSSAQALAGINLPFYNHRVIRQLTGLDLSEAMLDQARAKARLISSYEPVRFVQGDSQALPFDDNSFDSVVDTFSLCVYTDPVKALQEMARVVKPGA